MWSWYGNAAGRRTPSTCHSVDPIVRACGGMCGCPDKEVFRRIDLVHQAFDGEHTGYVSLSKVLLAMAQCFTTDLEEQVRAVLRRRGGAMTSNACT